MGNIVYTNEPIMTLKSTDHIFYVKNDFEAESSSVDIFTLFSYDITKSRAFLKW